MMEKAKNEKRRPISSTLGCLGFLFFLCFGTCGLLMILTPLVGKIQRTELAAELVPRAESLLNVPDRIVLEDFSIFLWVLEDYGETWNSASETVDIVCISTSESASMDFQNYSSLYVDGAGVLGTSDIVFLGMGGGLSDETRTPIWCAYGELQAGLHLIEFHLKDSFWGEPLHIQQWAIEID